MTDALLSIGGEQLSGVFKGQDRPELSFLVFAVLVGLGPAPRLWRIGAVPRVGALIEVFPEEGSPRVRGGGDRSPDVAAAVLQELFHPSRVRL